MMFVLFNSNTSGVTDGAGTASTSRESEFIPCFSLVRVGKS